MSLAALVKASLPSVARRTAIRVRERYRFYAIRFSSRPEFACPICRYHGPFADIYGVAGVRLYGKCPSCDSRERHRLQHCVLEELFETFDPSEKSTLHFAPEPCLAGYLRQKFKAYASADLYKSEVDYKLDLRAIALGDQSYDFVFASHVLEHVDDDRRALAEVRRILRPGGIAVLPVPIVSERSIEYPHISDNKHFRAPGLDYFDRYRELFDLVEVKTSDDYEEQYQLFVYEDRTTWPNERVPLRRPMLGAKHIDAVPICYRFN